VETPKKLTLQVAGAEEEEEERLILTRLYQSLNLLLNDQNFRNKNPSLHFKPTSKRGKKFGVLRQSRN
jgi:hypothetical protein